MLYYVDNLADNIKFYHSLLKKNGRLMIIIEAGEQNFILPMHFTSFTQASQCIF